MSCLHVEIFIFIDKSPPLDVEPWSNLYSKDALCVVSILCRGNKAQAPDDWMQMSAGEHTRQASPSAFPAISAHVVINWNKAPSEFHFVAAGR